MIETALDPVLEKRDENNEDWITEKISFNAAYGEERMLAYLFLTKKCISSVSDNHILPRSRCH